ncbi:MAG: hypothetical protein M5U35_00085 [Roseovarius sp.]|nr:hypothetical protein [Roseovarius sp.]
MDKAFRDAHAEEIEAFRREQAERNKADDLSDADILREVMNTVGKKGRLGEQVRCVVSVSMLTEGWDANNVTHILGLRAFGTQLICEQVIGRALRRLSYDADPDTGLFRTEYADIMGIDGLNFSAQPRIAPPQPPRDVINVRAVSPERDHLEITFPRGHGLCRRPALGPSRRRFLRDGALRPDAREGFGHRHHHAGHRGRASGSTSSTTGPPVSRPSPITSPNTWCSRKLHDANQRPRMHLIPAAKRIVSQWLSEGHLHCTGGTVPAQLLYREIADEVCDLIFGALIDKPGGASVLRAVLDPTTRPAPPPA